MAARAVSPDAAGMDTRDSSTGFGRGWGLWLAIALLALVLWMLVACASLPNAKPVAAVPPAVPSALAQQVNVHGSRGLLSEPAQKQVIARLAGSERGDLTAHHLAVLAAQGEVDLYRGNAARLLVDGPATFGAMKAAIQAARHRVLLESYIFEDTGIAAEIGRLLVAKAEQGVAVALLYDAVGSIGSDPQFFDALRARGVAVCAFNPINPVARPGYWGINHRNHRKLLVADADVAYTGGINISQVYASGSSGLRARKPEGADAIKDGWRDTQVELRGPVVAALAATFEQTLGPPGLQGRVARSPGAAQRERR
jgi:cardiolipin synthase A/B